MDFKKYFAESEKQYKIRIRTLVPLDDVAMERIEYAIEPYNPIDVSRPKKTIHQRSPLDFPNVDGGEVWIVDLVLGLPVSSYVLHSSLCKALKAPDAYVVVRNPNEPGETHTALLNGESDIDAEAQKQGLEKAPLLSTDASYPEHEEVDANTIFGDKYNAGLMQYLNDIEKSKPWKVIEPASKLFSWLDQPKREDQEPVQDTSNFNASIKDAPEVHPTAKNIPKIKVTNINGNVDDNDRTIKAPYKDSKGKKKTLSRKLDKEI